MHTTKPFESRAREIWFDLRGMGGDVERALDAITVPAHATFLVNQDQLPLRSRDLRVATLQGRGQPQQRSGEISVFQRADELLEQADGPSALMGRIASEADLKQFAADLVRSAATHGLVELADETNIPLELLIAWFQDTPTKIVKQVDTLEDGDIALRTLEAGADGVMLKVRSLEDLEHALKLVEVDQKGHVELTEWEVTAANYIGWGERALVDTVSLLTKTEGMLIGSTCNAFVMMCSETHYLPYMPLRPFRVNAGAVHSYLLGPDNKTHYLGDLGRGHKVSVVDTSGATRTSTVGRVKIERRPLIMLDFKNDLTSGSVVIQADWHVRIMGADGNPLHVTHCRPGTKLKGWSTNVGRHCGNPIRERLFES